MTGALPANPETAIVAVRGGINRYTAANTLNSRKCQNGSGTPKNPKTQIIPTNGKTKSTIGVEHLTGDYATNSGCIRAVNAKVQTIDKNQTTKLCILIDKLIVNVRATPMHPQITITNEHDLTISSRI